MGYLAGTPAIYGPPLGVVETMVEKGYALHRKLEMTETSTGGLTSRDTLASCPGPYALRPDRALGM